ncbi:single-stranded DNA-binding protein [Paraburkholderia silvatlantica]|uniref:Single-stranded DNA-binding protein n=1 Tax=Paraburkholderia silvatlantica TaxID=321895 RepID=A0ABR6FRW4_9BURK|nr:single-stranded DNA-binding protein [Paraburkholderia silvatlantica]MBB2930143.1 single-stranded DNA-binding protein [Paraburkholderia silvatlantica]PVY22484.1 single-stranded DNA-binding protein [Paraburkholderia silvatlantica]PXW28953.1 single-stranded DNA-binding protein [Paraburkholderia silvatlantica]
MIDALIAGTLACESQQRRAGNGNSYVLARLRVPQGDGPALFAAVFAFDRDVCEQLVALSPGDAVCIVGALKMDVWTPDDGEPRINLTITASALVTPYHVQRKRKAMQGIAGRQRATANSAEEEFQDDI